MRPMKPGQSLIRTQFVPEFFGTPVGLDYTALNVFFRSGTFIGDATAFEGVHARAFDLPPVTATSLSREQAIDAYIELFRQAVSRCIDAAGCPVCMGLTGGRDSRHIFLELCRQGSKPDLCWTIETQMGESRFATQLAAQHDVPHRKVPPSVGIRYDQEKNVLTYYSSLQHGWFSNCLEATSGFSTIYDGIGGDVLSAGLFLTPQAVALAEAGRTEEYVRSIVRRVPCLSEKLFPYEEAVELVHKEFLRYMPMPDPISAFYFANRTRRDIATAAFLIAGRGKQVMTPYLDDDLVKFLLSLSPAITVDHEFHNETIAREFPDCLIPYAHKVARSHAFIRRRARQGLFYIATRGCEPLRRLPVAARLIRIMLQPERDNLFSRVDGSVLLSNLCGGPKGRRTSIAAWIRERGANLISCLLTQRTLCLPPPLEP